MFNADRPKLGKMFRFLRVPFWYHFAPLCLNFGFSEPHSVPLVVILSTRYFQDAPKMPQDGPTCPKFDPLGFNMGPSRGQKSVDPSVGVLETIIRGGGC